jgi:hypothetical protein
VRSRRICRAASFAWARLSLKVATMDMARLPDNVQTIRSRRRRSGKGKGAHRHETARARGHALRISYVLRVLGGAEERGSPETWSSWRKASVAPYSGVGQSLFLMQFSSKA